MKNLSRQNALLMAVVLFASSMASAIDFDTTRAAQQTYIAARLSEGYSPDATCAAVTRYFGMDCRVECDPCFLGGPCKEEISYIVTYGRGLDIIYLTTITPGRNLKAI